MKNVWKTKEWKENRLKLIEKYKKCKICGSKDKLTPAHNPYSYNFNFEVWAKQLSFRCPKCDKRAVRWRKMIKPHFKCRKCGDVSEIDLKQLWKEYEEKLLKTYVSMEDAVLLCKVCHFKTHRNFKYHAKAFEPDYKEEDYEYY